MSSSPTTAARDPRQLKLLVQSLSDKDITKVAAFLRIGRERLHFDWEIVHRGELDVLMLGTDEAHTVPGMLDDPLATLRLIDSQAARRETSSLMRPLEYEPFIETLSEVERRIASKPRAAPVSEKARIDAPARPAPDARRAMALAPAARFRLRRWPPLALLQGDRYHQRLASFLSARQLDLDELARLSNVSRQECETFVAALIAADVLDVKPAATTPPEPTASRPPTTPAATTLQPVDASPAIDHGLFARIRRGMGLTWRR